MHKPAINYPDKKFKLKNILKTNYSAQDCTHELNQLSSKSQSRAQLKQLSTHYQATGPNPVTGEGMIVALITRTFTEKWGMWHWDKCDVKVSTRGQPL